VGLALFFIFSPAGHSADSQQNTTAKAGLQWRAMFAENTPNGVMNTMILREQCLLITTAASSGGADACYASQPGAYPCNHVFAREYSGNAKQLAHNRGRLVLSNGLGLLFSLG
jgi:hypothetical protein